MHPDQSSKLSPHPLGMICEAIRQGPWSWIQLRGGGDVQSWLTGEDVDLIGSQDAATALLDAAAQWVQQGLCHIHVQRQRSKKINLQIFSIDGRERIEFDLWIKLNQFKDGKSWLTYDHLAPFASKGSGAIKRLPLRLEWCLYIHHLHCKKKSLRSESFFDRLQTYRAQAIQEADQRVIKEVDLLSHASRLPSELLESSAKYLQKRIDLHHGVIDRNLARFYGEFFLRASHLSQCVSLIGCDGVGKSALIDALLKRWEPRLHYKKGKHLYRKSWVYKLAVIFLRPLMMQDRERFDETIAGPVYLRACVGLRLLGWLSRKKVFLLDRGLMDFVYVNRKTDRPSFSFFSFLSRWFGVRITTIHLVAPFEVLHSRKQEMTEKGQSEYDRAMFEVHVGRCPSHYTLYYNGMGLTESQQALELILTQVCEGRFSEALD